MEHAGISPDREDKRRLLLCASDAGGVSNIAALCGPAKAKGFEIHTVTCRLLAPLFEDSNILLIENLAGGIERFIRDLRPEVIICGTTSYDSPDREAIFFARKNGVPCVAIIDEWYNHLLRFSNRRDAKAHLFPNAIAVPDEFARSEAIAEGIPQEILHATGSPSLARIAGLGEEWRELPPAVPGTLAGTKDATVITFLSETHSLDYGRSPGDAGPLGPFIGYTEQSVCRTILAVLDLLPGKFLFVYRPHPAESDFPDLTGPSKKIELRLAPDVPLHSLCYHSDLVLGMRSMAILEARLIGCRVASFQPGLCGPQVCTAVRLGLAPFLEDAFSLSEWIAESVAKKRRHEPPSPRPDFANSDAAEKILRLAA